VQGAPWKEMIACEPDEFLSASRAEFAHDHPALLPHERD
jgi:hypothetical protein